jgi:hypothetical protein
MSLFDEADAKAAESVGALLNETVIWRPQVPPPDPYHIDSGGYPDPNRPIRQIEGIASWQPTGLPVSSGGTAGTGTTFGGTAVVTEATLMIDFEAALFQNEFAAYGKPKNGDRFELPEQDDGDQLVKVDRVGDDGSARVYAWCSVVSE